jgi:hypothetical protein
MTLKSNPLGRVSSSSHFDLLLGFDVEDCRNNLIGSHIAARLRAFAASGPKVAPIVPSGLNTFHFRSPVL